VLWLAAAAEGVDFVGRRGWVSISGCHPFSLHRAAVLYAWWAGQVAGQVAHSVVLHHGAHAALVRPVVFRGALGGEGRRAPDGPDRPSLLLLLDLLDGWPRAGGPERKLAAEWLLRACRLWHISIPRVFDRLAPQIYHGSMHAPLGVLRALWARRALAARPQVADRGGPRMVPLHPAPTPHPPPPPSPHRPAHFSWLGSLTRPSRSLASCAALEPTARTPRPPGAAAAPIPEGWICGWYCQPGCWRQELRLSGCAAPPVSADPTTARI
jgi:hypothetical protein